MSLSEDSAVGRLEGLRALRLVLASEIESGGKRDVAALARQLRETLREIAELEKLSPGKSVVDDLSARRQTRRSGTEGVAPAKRSGGKQRPGGG